MGNPKYAWVWAHWLILAFDRKVEGGINIMEKHKKLFSSLEKGQ